jgi:hypothetical protein
MIIKCLTKFKNSLNLVLSMFHQFLRTFLLEIRALWVLGQDERSQHKNAVACEQSDRGVYVILRWEQIPAHFNREQYHQPIFTSVLKMVT